MKIRRINSDYSTLCKAAKAAMADVLHDQSYEFDVYTTGF